MTEVCTEKLVLINFEFPIGMPGRAEQRNAQSGERKTRFSLVGDVRRFFIIPRTTTTAAIVSVV